MDFVYVFLVVTGPILIGVVWLSYAHSRKKRIATQQKGIVWLRALRLFLSNIQKHRGLSTTYINGNRDALEKIDQLEVLIAKDIDTIRRVDPWMASNDEWHSLVEHWDRLKHVYKRSRDAENNLLQHNRLIQNTLYLVEEMADEHALLMLRGADSSSMEFLWKDLLHAIEFLGQARAIGSGIAVKKSCTSVERIRMNYLYKKIQEKGLGITSFLPNGEQANKEIRALLCVIEEQLLGSRCHIESTDYFDMATKAIDFLYQQYDALLIQTKPS